MPNINKWSVRIHGVILENFKNVKHGEINLKEKVNNSEASVLGLYGQNGSGKTALIDSIDILRVALSGKKLSEKYADYINTEAQYATLKFRFVIKNENSVYHAIYEFKIRKDELQEEDTSQNIEDVIEHHHKYKTTIYNECLQFQYRDENQKIRMGSLIDTRKGEIFLPKSRFLELIGSDKKTLTDVLVAHKVAEDSSKSFIFSKQLSSIIHNNCKNNLYNILIYSLQNFGARELFVINTDNSGLISLNALPIAFKYKYTNEHKETLGRLAIPLNDSVLVPVEMEEIIKALIENMNIVLGEIIPGLEIKMHEINTELLKDANIGKRIQLASSRKGKEIPLKYESEGIKKIVSILQLLIVVYNSDSITLAIDELDTGIFEYLLGELLKVISEKGKGQLLFTSHNLRPLETIDKKFIAFTTVNSEKRYIRFVNIKGNNNLRDFYYRDILLGEQEETVYEATNNYAIMLAFKKAGDMYGAQENTFSNC